METIAHRVIKKTHKVHQCIMCYRKFQPGVTMHYFVGKCEGDFCYSHTCEACQELINHSSEREFPEGFIFEILGKDETPEMVLEDLLKSKNDNSPQLAERKDEPNRHLYW